MAKVFFAGQFSIFVDSHCGIFLFTFQRFGERLINFRLLDTMRTYLILFILIVWHLKCHVGGKMYKNMAAGKLFIEYEPNLFF